MNKRGPHGTEDKFKAKILLLFIQEIPSSEEIKPPFTRTKLVQYFKNEKSIDYHLYDSRNGLVTNRVLISTDGYLLLNLKDGSAVARMIKHLWNVPEIGPKIRYFFEKAFIEAFLSNYGDRFVIRLDLYQYLDKKNDRTRSLLSKEIDRQLKKEPNHFEELNIKIGELERLFMQYEPVNPDNNDIQQKNVKQEELISALIDFVWTRRHLDIQFMLAYILNVIEISRTVQRIERNWQNISKLELFERNMSGEFSLYHKSEKEIRKFLRKASPKALEIFMDGVIRKALKDSGDRYSSENDNLLSLYTGRIALASFLVKSHVVDNMTHYLAPLEIPTAQELSQAISTASGYFPAQSEVSDIIKELNEHRSTQEKIMLMEEKAIINILGLEMDILGYTQDFLKKGEPALRDMLNRFVETQKQKGGEG